MNYKTIIIKKIKELNLKLGIAESITGGMITSALIDEEDATKILVGTIVAPNIDSKKKLLNVNLSTINDYSEISPNVTKEMAMGIREKLNTDLSIAINSKLTSSSDEATVLVYFCIIVIDKIYEYEMLIPNETKMKNRITIASKVIEELFNLLIKLKK